MLKKTINYTDYNGVSTTDECYFNLTETELTKMAMLSKKPLSEKIETAIEKGDNATILELFEDIIIKSYGFKSEDGKRFVKDEERTKEFMQSEAYNKLFMELATNTDEAIAFIVNVLPKSLSNELQDDLSKKNA